MCEGKEYDYCGLKAQEIIGTGYAALSPRHWVFIVVIILFQACSYSRYGSGNKSRDILLKPGVRWTTELETNYYLNGNKASEGRITMHNPPGKEGTRFAFKKGVWRYWDSDGNLVWKEKYVFKKKDARSHLNMGVINEMPDSLENVLDSLFYSKPF